MADEQVLGLHAPKAGDGDRRSSAATGITEGSRPSSSHSGAKAWSVSTPRSRPDSRGSRRRVSDAISVANTDVPRPHALISKGQVKGRFGNTEYEIFNPKKARIGRLFKLKDKEGNLYAAKPCDRIAQKQFKREAMQYFHMDPHSNVLTITDIAHVLHMNEDLKLLVTPFATCGNLQECLSCCVVNRSLRIDLCRQMTEGVKHLHNQSPPLIHQNLKPDNVLMFVEKENLIAKVTDFGIMASGQHGIKLVSPSNTLERELFQEADEYLPNFSKVVVRTSSENEEKKKKKKKKKSITPKNRGARSHRSANRGRSASSLLKSPHQKQTLNYWAAPEQQPTSTKKITVKTDIFSLGLLCIYVLGKQESGSSAFAKSFYALNYHSTGVSKKIREFLDPYGMKTSRRVQNLAKVLGQAVSRYSTSRPTMKTFFKSVTSAAGNKKGKFTFKFNQPQPATPDDAKDNRKSRQKKLKDSEKQIRFTQFLDSMLNNRKTSIAYKFYSKDAEKGDPKAQYNLGNCYLKGIGMEKNDQLAVKWYTASAVQGNPEAQNNLGICYERGWGCEKDASIAFQWFGKAAEKKYSLAQFNLGLCYEQGIGTEVNLEKAASCYRLAAEKGTHEAMNNLALCYEHGYGVEIDQKRALNLFLESANRGDAQAEFNVALCYQKGIGTDENIGTSIEWYKRSAEHGYAQAQNNLAVFYQQAVAVAQDEMKACKWYITSAAQGYAEAQNNLGLCYQHGIGVPADPRLAVQWYTEASLQGYSEAQYNLAFCYLHGIGVERNGHTAFQWFQESADKNQHPDAQFQLGVCYHEGTGVQPNEQTAIMWCLRLYWGWC